jgi:hypothetical protein
MARLEEIIREARSLSPVERQKLRQALDQELEQTLRDSVQLPQRNNGEDDAIRKRRLEWLKSHRQEYGGQYVALDNDRLLAVGSSYHIAREQALAAGKPNAFITYLPKPDEIAEMGGWA